jgi:hypothetical protein
MSDSELLAELVTEKEELDITIRTLELSRENTGFLASVTLASFYLLIATVSLALGPLFVATFDTSISTPSALAVPICAYGSYISLKHYRAARARRLMQGIALHRAQDVAQRVMSFLGDVRVLDATRRNQQGDTWSE